MTVEIRGNPMPGGGFVATFTDVTAFRHAEAELKRANETLELRVRARTAEFESARAEAERANHAKTRWLAAVSHDLAQPLNAAHLFAHALAQRMQHDEYRQSLADISASLDAAESLLAGLLDISRLDSGGLSPQIEAFPLDPLLQALGNEFRLLAEAKGLRFHAARTGLWVRSDAQLLRRVLQNFLANAVRYTPRGGVLLGCRRQGEQVRIEVWDTGLGIRERDQGVIFEEFRRLDRGGQGLGLGLAISDRIAKLLKHPIGLRSQFGRGSVFSLALPRAQAKAVTVPPIQVESVDAQGKRVLVMDNDAAVLAGMRELLRGWQCEVVAARNEQEVLAALAEARPALMLFDFHLDDGDTGLALRERLPVSAHDIPCVIITADHSEAVRNAVRDSGAWLLHKPLKPIALRALMTRLLD
jgi:CheY-like chemotaxis protein